MVKYLFKKSSKGEECAIATGINHADAWYPHCLLVSILGAPMQIHIIDLTIILAYFAIVVTLGVLVTKKMSKNIHWYFLGGNSLPWWMLGVSNASGMFDITGTMWLVYLLFVYGLKNIAGGRFQRKFEDNIQEVQTNCGRI